MTGTAQPRTARARLAAGGVLLVLLLAPFVTIAWTLGAERALSLRMAEQTGLLSRYEAKLAELDGKVARRDSTTGSMPVFLAGRTRAIAGAELRRRFIATVEAAGGELTESEFIPATSEIDGTEVLRLRASIVASNDAIQKILFETETYRPVLLLSSLSIQASTDAGNQEEAPALLATIVMDGHWKAVAP